jgi:hypothetical protein
LLCCVAGVDWHIIHVCSLRVLARQYETGQAPVRAP